MTIRALIRAGLAALLCAAPVHADLIRVDAVGGADFTDLPEAVAAADEGDVLLLAPGPYSGVTIDGLSLHIVGDAPGVVILGHVVIAVSGRVAPQLNVQSLGFSFAIAAGAWAVFLSTDDIGRLSAEAARQPLL